MMKNDMHPLNEETVLFIKREAARETQGTISGQARAKHLARPVVNGAQGAQISAHELEAAVPVLNKIKDETLRKTVQSYFLITTKYQALNMLIAEHSPLRQAAPEVLNELIDAVTSTDRQAKGKARQVLGY